MMYKVVHSIMSHVCHVCDTSILWEHACAARCTCADRVCWCDSKSGRWLTMAGATHNTSLGAGKRASKRRAPWPPVVFSLAHFPCDTTHAQCSPIARAVWYAHRVYARVRALSGSSILLDGKQVVDEFGEVLMCGRAHSRCVGSLTRGLARPFECTEHR